MSFKGFARLPFYLLFGPLIAYLASLVALSALMAAEGKGAQLGSMWAYALPLTPVGWLMGLLPFVLAAVVAKLGGRLSPVAAYIAGAAVAATAYWVLAVIFFNPPRAIDGVDVTYVLLLAAPIGAAVASAICEWIAKRVRQRNSAEAM